MSYQETWDLGIIQRIHLWSESRTVCQAVLIQCNLLFMNLDFCECGLQVMSRMPALSVSHRKRGTELAMGINTSLGKWTAECTNPKGIIKTLRKNSFNAYNV